MQDAGPALPAFFEFNAEPGWQAVDFVSDLHLSPSMPRTFTAWARHMLSTPADAVILLGDVFEVWVGDDMRSQPFERRCVDVLADAASRRQVAFMAGNRDFLVGSTMLRECGVMGLPDPAVLNAWGQRLLLSHGDALCLDDTDYQAFRRQVRGDTWQQDFLARPLAERIDIAADMRRRSEARRQGAAESYADVDAATAVRWMHAMGTPEMVHGHTHRPGSKTLAPGFRRHVLSDWDLDHPTQRRAEVLRLTRDGLRRIPVTA